MPDVHETDLAPNGAAAIVDNGPESSTGVVTDEARPDEISSPEKEPAPLRMEELVKLHPRCWTPVWFDPELAADAEALIPLYVSVNDSPDVLAAARDLAEAQIDHRRVRAVITALEKSVSGKKYVIGEPAMFLDIVVLAKRQPRKFPAQVVLAIYRYERRSYSRWMKASKAFDTTARRHARNGRALPAAFRRRDQIQRGAARQAPAERTRRIIRLCAQKTK